MRVKFNDIKTEASTEIAGARKDDGGKPPIFSGVLSYFPRAVEEVAAVSAFGARKYAWNGWLHVDNGVSRYTDALVRHLNAEAKGAVLDDESRLHHAAHAAWGALARLELMLREEDAKKSNP